MSSTLGNRFKFQLIGRVVANISISLLIISLARLLTNSQYGLLFLTISVIGMIQLFSEFGIAKSAARYISEYKQKEPGQIIYIIRTTIAYNLIAVSIVSVFIFIFHEQLAEYLDEPNLSPLLLLGILYLIFATLAKYVRLVLQGFEAIEATAAIQVIDRVSRLSISISLVVLGYEVYGALGGYIIGFALATIVGFSLIYTRYYQDITADKEVEAGLRQRIARYAVPISVTNAATKLDTRVDTILVGFFIGPTSVSFYVLGKQIVDFIQTPAKALGFTISPTLGAEKADGNIEQVSHLYENTLIHTLLLYIPAGVGIIIIAEPFIEVIFGPKYNGTVPVLQVFGLYTILLSVTRITSWGLDYLGRARSRAIAKGVTSILNVILNIILIPTMGLIGAPIATVVTHSLFTLANLYIIQQEFELRMPYILKNISLISLVTIIMAASIYPIRHLTDDVFTLVSTVLIGVLIWAILSSAMGIFDIQKVKSMLL